MLKVIELQAFARQNLDPGTGPPAGQGRARSRRSASPSKVGTRPSRSSSRQLAASGHGPVVDREATPQRVRAPANERSALERRAVGEHVSPRVADRGEGAIWEVDGLGLEPHPWRGPLSVGAADIVDPQNDPGVTRRSLPFPARGRSRCRERARPPIPAGRPRRSARPRSGGRCPLGPFASPF